MVIASSWGKEPGLTINKHKNSCFNDKNALNWIDLLKIKGLLKMNELGCKLYANNAVKIFFHIDIKYK